MAVEKDFSGWKQGKGIIVSSMMLLLLQYMNVSAQNMLESYSCTNTIGNYTHDSLFHANLNQIVTHPYEAMTQIRYGRTIGNGVDQVNAITDCWGYIDSSHQCITCINNAINNLTKVCPNQKEAIGWNDDCMFRYSNNYIIGHMSLTPFYKQVNSTKFVATNASRFSQELASLADRLIFTMIPGFISIGISEKISTPAGGERIYGLMQCIIGLSGNDCKSCLNHTKEELLSCCDHVVGARYRTPSCAFRFEIYRFSSLFDSGDPEHKAKIIIIIVCATVASLVLTLSLCVFITRRRRQRENAEHKVGGENEELLKNLGTETTRYDFASISAATKGFSVHNRLGRGGFGEVYKGVLSDGKEIAVKRLSATSGQGNKEFENEVLLLAKLQHSCLVKLLGYCLEGKERLLVYEFMANGSLDKVLFDLENRSWLDWEARYRIMKNVARGLLYLHEDSRLLIIHRDLKTGNILLDGDMNAKISDFGMARLFDRDKGEVITKRIAGTHGYMAPEYAMHGMFSVKSDVYSYGVMLLEILCGKKTYSFLTEERQEDLPSYAYKSWEKGKASDLIDPTLTVDSNSVQDIMRCIHISLLCVQENADNRPTMATVIQMLQSSTLILPSPSRPRFLIRNTETVVAPIVISRYDVVLNDDEIDSYQCPR